MRYLTETPALGGVLFVGKKDEFIIASDVELAERTGVPVVRPDNSSTEALFKLLKERRIKRLGVDLGGISYALYSKLRAKGIRLIDVGPAIFRVRGVKEKAEVDKIREACRLSDRAMAAAAKAVEVGATERDVRKAAMCAVLDRCETQAFDFIIASGENSLYTHCLPSGRKIRREDAVIVDLGVTVDGYNSDITRTFCIEPGKKLRQLYDTVAGAQDVAIDGLRNGMRCADIYEKAGKFFETKGVRKYWKYGLGHGVGLEVHEAPSIARDSQDVIREGMVFTIEPGIHIRGVGGVRIEDTILLAKRGPEKLTRSRYGLRP
jgi:Xaa-Pro aminopeptidase